MSRDIFAYIAERQRELYATKRRRVELSNTYKFVYPETNHGCPTPEFVDPDKYEPTFDDDWPDLDDYGNFTVTNSSSPTEFHIYIVGFDGTNVQLHADSVFKTTQPYKTILQQIYVRFVHDVYDVNVVTDSDVLAINVDKYADYLPCVAIAVDSNAKIVDYESVAFPIFLRP